MTRTFTFSISSITLASLINTPTVAPNPVPTITDIGVARPNAHGHAIIRTVTALANANTKAGSGPQIAHVVNEMIEILTTTGTKNFEIRSAKFCIGAFERLALLTMSMICASSVSAPIFLAFISKLPVPFTVPPTTESPSIFSTEIDSPVIIDSSTELLPFVTMPSTGIFSPGLIFNKSFTFTCAKGILCSTPFLMTVASGGTKFKRARMALFVLPCAFSSNTWPNNINVSMTVAASKYR